MKRRSLPMVANLHPCWSCALSHCPTIALPPPPSVPPCPYPPRQHLFTYSKQYKEIANIDKIYHPSYNLMSPNKEPVSWKNLTPATEISETHQIIRPVAFIIILRVKTFFFFYSYTVVGKVTVTFLLRFVTSYFWLG